MTKSLFLFLTFLFLTGCSQKIEDPEMFMTMIPRTFEAIYFDAVSPYQMQQFFSLQEGGHDCSAEKNLIEKYTCSTLTGWYGEYRIPERELTFTERTGCWKEDANSWVLSQERNPAFYVSWDKVFSLSLRTNVMYIALSEDFSIREEGKFWTNTPEKVDEEYLSSTFFIQYFPLPKNNNIISIIDTLSQQGILRKQGNCDEFLTLSFPENTLCYRGEQGYNADGEPTWQHTFYFFHPQKDFHYKLSIIEGNPQCEGNGFWSIIFFSEEII